MLRRNSRFVGLAYLVGLAAGAAGAQTTTPSLSERSPSANVRAGAVAERAPGTWVNAARARHVEIIDERVNARRSGEAPETDSGGGSSGGSTGGSDSGSLGGLGDLLDLLGGGGGSLTDLLGSLGASGTTTVPPAGTTTTPPAGTTTSPPSGTVTDTASGGSSSGGATIDDLLRLRDQAGASARTQSRADAAGSSWAGRKLGGALARLPQPLAKSDGRAQTAGGDDEEPSFRVRWIDAMVGTFFDALTLAFRTPQFVDVLADGLRDLMTPPADTGSDTDGDGDGDGSGDGGSGDGGSGDGADGIEDLPPTGDGSGDGGSLI